MPRVGVYINDERIGDWDLKDAIDVLVWYGVSRNSVQDLSWDRLPFTVWCICDKKVTVWCGCNKKITAEKLEDGQF